MSDPDPAVASALISDLRDEVERLLVEVEKDRLDLGAVNWADLSVADIEERRSLLRPEEGCRVVVVIEEASPDSRLAAWVLARISERFPGVWVECEW